MQAHTQAHAHSRYSRHSRHNLDKRAQFCEVVWWFQHGTLITAAVKHDSGQRNARRNVNVRPHYMPAVVNTTTTHSAPPPPPPPPPPLCDSVRVFCLFSVTSFSAAASSPSPSPISPPSSRRTFDLKTRHCQRPSSQSAAPPPEKIKQGETGKARSGGGDRGERSSSSQQQCRLGGASVRSVFIVSSFGPIYTGRHIHTRSHSLTDSH